MGSNAEQAREAAAGNRQQTVVGSARRAGFGQGLLQGRLTTAAPCCPWRRPQGPIRAALGLPVPRQDLGPVAIWNGSLLPQKGSC
jgi:hypothetical protein